MSIENKIGEENIEYQEEQFSLPEQIIDEIKNRTAVAATDAAMAGTYLATH